MYGAYLDETGNTGTNLTDPTQQFHYVGALLVPESSWQLLTGDMQEIALRALGKKIATSPSFEFHGSRLFSGNSPWNVIPDREKRMEIYADCLDLLKKHKLRFTYGRCDKQKLQRYKAPMHPHEISFWLTLERVGLFLKENDSLGFIVADDCATKVKQIARSGLAEYRKNGPPFGKPVDVSRVIDTVHFMDSSESSHLQMCDLCLWVIQRFRSIPIARRLDATYRSLFALWSKVNLIVTETATFPY